MRTSDKWQVADGTAPDVAELECGTQILLLSKDVTSAPGVSC